MKKVKNISWFQKEFLFQLIIYALVFSMNSFSRNSPDFEVYKVVFFANYALGAILISYYLLPRFLYQKEYLRFFIYGLITVAGVILIEEAILEQIYFPDTRGKSFPGISLSLLDVLPTIVMLVGAKFAWDALGKQREVDKLKEAVKESELQFLKTQINPHFLFNNLNNLYAYAIEQSPKTPDIILELAGVLRYMLYECKAEYVPLTKEIGQLKNFINLNEMQIEDRGQISFKSQNIQSSYQIAPLILIVFIENAFKHSTASQASGIFIDIKVQLSEEGILEFTCENSFQQQSNTSSLSKGIGLENVKKRLQLLYPNAHQLNIQKDENLYKVRLFIDLK